MKRRRFSRGEFGFAFFVCVAGVFVGNFVGTGFWMAGGLSLPGIFGAAGGLLAGVIWSRFMIPRRSRGCGYAIGMGTVMGVAVGMLATVILHLTAIGYWAEGGEHIPVFLIGLVGFGVPAGAVTGLLCGILLCLLLPRQRGEVRPIAADSTTGEVDRS